MASTVFVDQSTLIISSWLNDVNNSIYTPGGALRFPTGAIGANGAVPVSNGTSYVDNTPAQVRAVLGLPSTVGVSGNSLVSNGTSYIDTAGPYTRKNRIFNGNFDVWQASTGTPDSAGYSADMWVNAIIGDTVTVSQQAFTLGQTSVPGEPRYFHRHVVTSVAGAGNCSNVGQRIESSRTLAGQTATLSFWAKADASKNIAVDITQQFGTGGSPSSSVQAASNLYALTSSWQKFTTTVSIPSISGKTLGTNGNDFLLVRFWFDAGSSFNSTTSNLGQQSGTFDIARVQLEPGSLATDFEVLSFAEELQRCQRYFWKTFPYAVAPAQAAGAPGAVIYWTWTAGVGLGGITVPCPVRMRATPGITTYNPASANANWRNFTAPADSGAPSIANQSDSMISLSNPGVAGDAAHQQIGIHFTADARM